MVRWWRRGRHGRRVGRRSRPLALVLLALVGAGGIAAVLVTAGGDRTVPVPVRTGAEATADGGAGAQDAVSACRTAVARGRDAVAAAGPSFSHWAAHVRAQLDYDAGTATLEQTRARWEASKATADADLADFATGYAAFEATRDGCAAPVGQSPAGGPASDDPVMARCRPEFDAVSAAVVAGKAVVDDWAAHVAMMKAEEHYGAAEYGPMWRNMVTAAPADLDRFARASLAMSDHVDCATAR